MSRTPRRGRVRLQSYVDSHVGQRLEAFCAANRVTESAVVQAAVLQYLDGTGDATLLLRRLDRLGRAGARTQRDVELLSEALATWIKLWFAHTPQIPDDAKASARASAHARFRNFVAHLAEQFSDGHRFLDDLPRECVAEEAELAAATLASAPDMDSAQRK